MFVCWFQFWVQSSCFKCDFLLTSGWSDVIDWMVQGDWGERVFLVSMHLYLSEKTFFYNYCIHFLNQLPNQFIGLILSSVYYYYYYSKILLIIQATNSFYQLNVVRPSEIRKWKNTSMSREFNFINWLANFWVYISFLL